VNEHKDDMDDEPGMWEETFKSHSDSKPNGTTASLYLCLFSFLC